MNKLFDWSFDFCTILVRLTIAMMIYMKIIRDAQKNYKLKVIDVLIHGIVASH